METHVPEVETAGSNPVSEDENYREDDQAEQRARELLSSLDAACMAEDASNASKGDTKARKRFVLNAYLNRPISGDNASMWTCRRNGCDFKMVVADDGENERLFGEPSCEPGKTLKASLESE